MKFFCRFKIDKVIQERGHKVLHLSTISLPILLHRTSLVPREEVLQQQHWLKWVWNGHCDKCVGEPLQLVCFVCFFVHWLQDKNLLQCHIKFQVLLLF